MSISTPPTDPTIDPITGLPVLSPSGPVQQIPLGQEVFPYADLNATAQPTRGPIYGDDIIPTSGLVTAPDVQMRPRSIQSTTTRELRVREAVFQSLGKSIPDGTTAPIDVNVTSSGGGGGPKPIDLQIATFGNVSTGPVTYPDAFTTQRYIYGWEVSATMLDDLGSTPQDSPIEMTLDGAVGLQTYKLEAFFLWAFTASAGIAYPYHNTVILPNPNDITLSGSGSTESFDLRIAGIFARTSFIVKIFSSEVGPS